MLQKFVDSGFLNNSIIEVNQARYFTTFIKRTAKAQVLNFDEHIFERMATFDGTETHSLSNIIKGQLTFTLKHFMNLISERVETASDHRLILK